MIDKLTNTGIQPVREVQRTERTRVNPQNVSAQAPTSFPDSPPPEVLHALDAGARVMKELSDARVELHFAIENHDAGGKHVRIQVRESDGNVVREIPTRKLLDILAGESRGLTVDALG
jgi:uncharacterized FlaG/YvyC family protein